MRPCSTCSVQSSFCPLPDPVRATFDALKTSASVAAHTTLFEEGEPCDHVVVVCSGRVKLLAGSENGRVLLLRLVEPGEILGAAEAVLHAGYECSAVALEPSVIALLPRETFVRFMASSTHAACRVNVALSDQYRRAQREERFFAFGDTSMGRLAQLLVEWSAQHGRSFDDGVHIPLQVTHGDLAHAIGATRETVTRLLSELHHTGVVERTRDEIVVHRIDTLRHLCGA